MIIFSGLLLLFLFPVLQCTCFYLAIGDNPKNLKIGIVNDEVDSYEDCLNTSLVTTYVHDYECDLNKVSCRYLSKIPPDLTKQVIVKSCLHERTSTRYENWKLCTAHSEDIRTHYITLHVESTQDKQNFSTHGLDKKTNNYNISLVIF